MYTTRGGNGFFQKNLFLSLATISCSSSLALAQIYEGYTHINSHQTNSKKP
ncbi:hypothetical protein IRA69_03885 [Campylobacter hepaticus]|nr:hypothetical protein IRA69_03885 [Campylobacter hepaticus]